MLTHYARVALRNLSKNKGHYLINISGLAVGMTSCILILLYVQNEYSYDQFHPNADHIYRIVNGDNARTPIPLAPNLRDTFSEITAFTRLKTVQNAAITYRKKTFYDDRILYVDDTYFQVFGNQLAKGDPQTALKPPQSIIISQEMAQKYFGNTDPMGKTLQKGDKTLTITGVMTTIPHTSHFQADALMPLAHTRWDVTIQNREWYEDSFYTYILLPKAYAYQNLEQKFPKFVEELDLPDWFKNSNAKLDPKLQPLTNIHLHSHLQNEIGINGNAAYVHMLLVTAIFILVIASINFMNLTTARSANRAKEVAMRKVVGASRTQLIRQFLGESIAMSFLGLLLALLLLEMILPAFNALANKTLTFAYLSHPLALLTLILWPVVLGCVAGSYPALFLSAYQPVSVFKGTLIKGKNKGLLRKTLVTTQFTISIALIIGTGIVYQQLNYLRNKPLGFDKTQAMVLKTNSATMQDQYIRLKQKLLQNPQIVNIASAATMPGRPQANLMLYPIRYAETKLDVHFYSVDYDYAKTLDLELVAGRDFSAEDTGGKIYLSEHTDTKGALIINETAARQLGWQNPQNAIRKRIEVWNGWHSGTIVGVVKDFHLQSLHQPIAPTLFVPWGATLGGQYIIIRLQTNQMATTVDFIEKTWHEINPTHPIQFTFLDEDIDKLYRSEERLGTLFSTFAFLAIFVACLGLLGLTAIASEQRTKEIGIRKVLGASTPKLMFLLSKEFLTLVLAANLLAWPIAYYAMTQWLSDFPYRTHPQIETFLLSGLIALIVALATVAFQITKSAKSNPIESLRYE